MSTTPSRQSTRAGTRADAHADAHADAARPTMRAAVIRRFGGPEVVRIEDVPRPTPRDGELLIRVHASTVSVADHRLRAKDLPKGLWIMAPIALGVFRPRTRVLGMDAAGVVEAVGAGVTDYRPGDRVVVGLGSAFGGHAEYVRVPATGRVAHLPEGIAMTDAAAIPFGGLTALHFLREAGVREGSEVLVNGASGAVGTAAVQLAKIAGARVTAVCGEAADLVRDLGADAVIDYRTQDLAAGPATYDVVIECAGTAPFSRVEQIIRPGGALALVIADAAGMLGARRATRRTGKRVIAGNIKVTGEDLAHLVDLTAQGRYRPVVDRVLDLDDVVAAHAYVDTGRKKGNVVLRLA